MPKYDGVLPLQNRTSSIWKYFCFTVVGLILGGGVFVAFDSFEENGLIWGDRIDESTIVDPDELERIE